MTTPPLAAVPALPGTRPAGQPAWVAGLSLDRRFALVGSVVAIIGMLVIGHEVSARIESSVVRNSAISSATYMEAVIAPLSQELSQSSALSPATIDRLRALLDRPPLSQRIASVKIWRPGGLVAFSSDPALIGRTFPPAASLRRAWAGELSASFDDLEDEEDEREASTGMPLLEVYNPIHSIVTGEIIAVAEFYLDSPELRDDLRAASASSWALVALVSAATFAALFGIVRAGSRTITRQTADLTHQLGELARLNAQNEALRERVESASRRASETNERYLRRLSAELHDGPAQGLALASLRLDALKRRAPSLAGDPEVAELQTTLNEAMGDIRDLCRGLTLPRIEGRSIRQTVQMAIEAHERRSGTTVALAAPDRTLLDAPAPQPLLICIYRVVQEGLMNGFRHAKGAGQKVGLDATAGRLTLTVADDGPGFEPEHMAGTGLGLNGLAERVESMGGEFRIDSAPGRGTRISATLPLGGPT